MAPPSCFVGDVFAFTDANYGIAFGPAGEQRGVIGDATGLSYSYNVPERDILTANQINYFRTLPGVQGVVLWGASSLDNTGSVMADIAARRVVSRVEKNLSKVLRSFTFDMPLPDMLDSIASITTATLQAMLGAEGLLDFSVLCDSTNNPSPSLQMGDIYLEIDIVPTPTAKRIMLGVTINKHTGIGFTENG
jgi:phage tail sheath protein FI